MFLMRNIVIQIIVYISCIPLLSAEGKMGMGNQIDIWYETFGQEEDPALLLIMGGMAQGILWPTEFCQQLADKGFYVIRYDNRDTGFTTCFDYQKDPYTLLDMAKDGAGLLDYLSIEKAHIVSFSIGGPIAELLSVHFPEKVLTLSLIATSIDMRPCILAYEGGEYPDNLTLPKPTERYTQWMHKFLKGPPLTEEEQLEQKVECWAILNGDVVPFEEEMYRKIHREFLARLRHPESMANHIFATKASFDLVLDVPKQVTVPTVIFHGTEDPILPIEHGMALSEAIPHAKFIIVLGMGHVLNGCFYDLIVSEIQNISKK